MFKIHATFSIYLACLLNRAKRFSQCGQHMIPIFNRTHSKFTHQRLTAETQFISHFSPPTPTRRALRISSSILICKTSASHQNSWLRTGNRIWFCELPRQPARRRNGSQVAVVHLKETAWPEKTPVHWGSSIEPSEARASETFSMPQKEQAREPMSERWSGAKAPENTSRHFQATNLFSPFLLFLFNLLSPLHGTHIVLIVVLQLPLQILALRLQLLRVRLKLCNAKLQARFGSIQAADVFSEHHVLADQEKEKGRLETSTAVWQSRMSSEIFQRNDIPSNAYNLDQFFQIFHLNKRISNHSHPVKSSTFMMRSSFTTFSAFLEREERVSKAPRPRRSRTKPYLVSMSSWFSLIRFSISRLIPANRTKHAIRDVFHSAAGSFSEKRKLKLCSFSAGDWRGKSHAWFQNTSVSTNLQI